MDKVQPLSPEHPVRDIDGTMRYVDFALWPLARASPSLTELAARLRPDAALCLERYFRPEDQHVLYATAEDC
jgi:hypothetical protein